MLCFIAAMAQVRVNWAESFERWIPNLRSDQIKVIMKTKDVPDALVNIVSYDLGTTACFVCAASLWRYTILTTFLAVVRKKDITPNKFRLIIADESHNIKSWKAKRTECLQPLLKEAKRCILLTGVLF